MSDYNVIGKSYAHSSVEMHQRYMEMSQSSPKGSKLVEKAMQADKISSDKPNLSTRVNSSNNSSKVSNKMLRSIVLDL